jgi:hypothetical protein
MFTRNLWSTKNKKKKKKKRILELGRRCAMYLTPIVNNIVSKQAMAFTL